MSKTWRFFFGGSGHGSESSCQISAYYKLFPGLHVFCRISIGLKSDQFSTAGGGKTAGIPLQNSEIV